MKRQKDLLDRIHDAGFTDTSEFVKANLHYLPLEKQKLFYRVDSVTTDVYQGKVDVPYASFC